MEVENNQQSQSEQESQVQSNILTEEQVSTIQEGGEITSQDNEVTLPSDDEFVMPDKFAGKSAEDIARAYLELEKMKSKTEEPVQEEAPKEEVLVPSETVNSFKQKFIDNGGQFTEQDYADLAAQGYDKDFVDTYVQGVQAKEQAEAIQKLNNAGVSIEDFQSAINWARESWTPEQIQSYNDALEGANDAASAIIVKDLIAKHKAGSTQPTTYQSNEPQKQKATQGYANKSEMAKDMSDPRYSRDPKFNAMVAEKVAKTDWL